MADLNNMQFGMKTPVGPWNHVLDMGLDPPRGRVNFGGCSPIEMH